MTGNSPEQPSAPRVFISHASEDKARFVIPFAEQLRANGIDAWVDEWEMLDGDSLVTIFDGIDEASAVIVVLSAVSITKRWVAEELDAAVVKRINEGSKLIPIVLDNLDPKTEVPAPLRHLRLRVVPDPSQLADVVENVVRSIFGEVKRPPLGAQPTYVNSPAARIHDLDRIDSLVLRIAGIEAVRDYGDTFVTAEFLASATAELGITEAQAIESLEVLDAEHYVDISGTMAPGIRGMQRFTLTRHGIETYLRSYEPEYPKIEATVISRLAEWQHDQGTERDLVEATGAPGLIVRHLLDTLAALGHLRLSKPVGGPQGWRFYGVSMRLRRLAKR